jgi:hypothetical protein
MTKKKDDFDLKDQFKAFVKKSEAWDLSKLYPNYINKWIFRFFLLLMGVVVVADFVLNGYSFVNFSYECVNPERGYCLNPFYKCPPMQYFECQREVPDFICKYDFCDQAILPNGFKVGRTDWLSQNGVLLMWLCLPAAFVANHLWYMTRRKKKELMKE